MLTERRYEVDQGGGISAVSPSGSTPKTPRAI